MRPYSEEVGEEGESVYWLRNPVDERMPVSG